MANVFISYSRPDSSAAQLIADQVVMALSPRGSQPRFQRILSSRLAWIVAILICAVLVFFLWWLWNQQQKVVVERTDLASAQERVAKEFATQGNFAAAL